MNVTAVTQLSAKNLLGNWVKVIYIHISTVLLVMLMCYVFDF